VSTAESTPDRIPAYATHVLVTTDRPAELAAYSIRQRTIPGGDIVVIMNGPAAAPGMTEKDAMRLLGRSRFVSVVNGGANPAALNLVYLLGGF